jgi:hypothetical protein
MTGECQVSTGKKAVADPGETARPVFMVVCGTLCASGFDPQDNFLHIDSKNAASLCTP